jgi:SulP family sulfate permease
MVEPHNVRAVMGATRSDAVVLVVTATVTIAFDLIVAIELGVAVAALLALRAVARTTTATIDPLPPELDVDDEQRLLHDHIVVYRLDGSLFFGAAQRFLTELTAISDVKVVILRLPDLQMLDATGAHTLGEIVSELESRQITVLLKRPRPDHLRALRSVGALDRLAHERHLFHDLDKALEHARLHVRRALPVHAMGEDDDQPTVTVSARPPVP